MKRSDPVPSDAGDKVDGRSRDCASMVDDDPLALPNRRLLLMLLMLLLLLLIADKPPDANMN